MIDLTIAVGLLIFWQPEEGSVSFWICASLFALFLFMALGSFKRAFFASDNEIERMVQGDYNAKDKPDPR